MQRGEKKLQLNKNNSTPYTFSDQATRKKVKQHLSDINDVITEDDIKNAKIPGDETTGFIPETAEAIEKPNDDSLPAEEKTITPWDIIKE